MSDANLMAFGGAVSFIALAGFYAYLRECFIAGELSEETEARNPDVENNEVREVA